MKVKMGLLILLLAGCLWQAGAAELLLEDFDHTSFLSVGGDRFDPSSKVEAVTEPAKVGGAAKFAYVFGASGSPRYVELFINKPVPINSGRVSVWVYGNGSGNPLRARVRAITAWDSISEFRQSPAGKGSGLLRRRFPSNHHRSGLGRLAAAGV